MKLFSNKIFFLVEILLTIFLTFLFVKIFFPEFCVSWIRFLCFFSQNFLIQVYPNIFCSCLFNITFLINFSCTNFVFLTIFLNKLQYKLRVYKYFFVIYVCTSVSRKNKEKKTTHGNGWMLVGSRVRCVAISWEPPTDWTGRRTWRESIKGMT